MQQSLAFLELFCFTCDELLDCHAWASSSPLVSLPYVCSKNGEKMRSLRGQQAKTSIRRVHRKAFRFTSEDFFISFIMQ